MEKQKKKHGLFLDINTPIEIQFVLHNNRREWENANKRQIG